MNEACHTHDWFALLNCQKGRISLIAPFGPEVWSSEGEGGGGGGDAMLRRSAAARPKVNPSSHETS